LLDLDYSTFVLLPGTKNPAAGMMMLSKHGETIVLDERLAALESSGFDSSVKSDEPSSPSFSSQPNTPPFHSRQHPPSPTFTADEPHPPPCRNGVNCTIPMCTYSHPSSHSSHFSRGPRLSFSSAPFMPSYSPSTSPVKQQRFEPNKYYDNSFAPPTRVSSGESKHYEAFSAPLGLSSPLSLSSRTSSTTSSRSSSSSNSPERSPDINTRTLSGPNQRRMNHSRKQQSSHYDATFGSQGDFSEFSRHQGAPIVLYANAN